MRRWGHLVLVCVLSGCATMGDYDPIASATHQVMLLNEEALALVKVGMSADEVHRLMGDETVIGYMSNEASQGLKPAQVLGEEYQPLTIPNPYKSEELKSSDGVYLSEYYAFTVVHPDGKITDDELVPLVFKDGILAGRGWDFARSKHPKN